MNEVRVGKGIFSKEWWLAAFVRAMKTFAQTFVGMVTVGLGFQEIDWIRVLSVSAVAAVLSIVTSVAGIPEVTTDGTIQMSDIYDEYGNQNPMPNKKSIRLAIVDDTKPVNRVGF